MPIYEYTCPDCSEKFEKLVRSMSASETKVACPKCGKRNATRSLSVFAVSSDARSSQSPGPVPGMCGRCGGPGPCANG